MLIWQGGKRRRSRTYFLDCAFTFSHSEKFSVVRTIWDNLLRLSFRLFDCEGNEIYYLHPRIAGWLEAALLRLFLEPRVFAVLRTVGALCALHRTASGNNEPVWTEKFQECYWKSRHEFFILREKDLNSLIGAEAIKMLWFHVKFVHLYFIRDNVIISSMFHHCTWHESVMDLSGMANGENWKKFSISADIN